MALTVVSNDAFATRVGRGARTSAQNMGEKENCVMGDDKGHVCTIGRGETNINITYFSLRNDSGTEVFIYPNAAGDGLLASTTKP